MSLFTEILATEHELHLRDELRRAIAIESLRKLQMAEAVQPVDRLLLCTKLLPAVR